MKKARRFFAFLLVTFLSVLLPVQSVMAAFQDISCDASGVASGNILNVGDVVTSASGPVDPNNPCGLVSVDNIFSAVGCNYILVLNDVFSKFYCALQFGMREMVAYVVGLFLVIYGIKLLIGTQEATGGAAIVALLKIGTVYMFVLQGTTAVSILYKFFIGFIEETVAWVFSGINCPFIVCPGSGGNVPFAFSEVDKKIKGLLTGFDDGAGGKTLGIFDNNGELIIFFIVLVMIAVPLFLIAWSLIKMTILVFVRSLVTFMLSITAVAFLISLSPIFFSFMLFNSTYILFDNWLRFLVSYSLQPMVIFAIFSLWLIIVGDFLGFVGDLTKVIVILPAYSEDKGAILTIEDRIAFCPLFYPSDKDISITSSTFPFKFNLGGPQIQCCQLVTNPPLLDPVCAAPTATAVTPEQYLLDLAPYTKERLLSYKSIVRQEGFIYFLAYNFIALYAIAAAFFHLIEMTPKIAQQLSRSQASMPLGAGFGNGGGLGSMISNITSSTRNKAAKATNTISERLVKMSTQRN